MAMEFMKQDDDDDDDEFGDDNEGFSAFSTAEGGYKSQRALIIFLIDCHPAMLLPRKFEEEGEKSFFARCVRAAYDVCRDKVKQGKTDHVGVLLYNCKQKDNIHLREGVRVAMPLQEPSVASLSSLAALAEGKGVPEPGPEKPGAGEKSSLEEGMGCCLKTFNDSAVKEGKRAIFILTANDNPLPPNDKSCLVRAKDCLDAGIAVDVFPLTHPRALEREEPSPCPPPFNHALFYQSLLELVLPEAEADEIETRLTKRLLGHLREEVEGGVVSRALATLQLTLCAGKGDEGGVSIPVKVFTLALETKTKASVYLDSRTNKPVKTVTEKLCTATGRLLMDHDIESYFLYGASELPFSKEEVASCKALDVPPGLQLLGFAPSSMLEARLTLRSPYFLRAHDTPAHTEGGDAAQAFRALWQVLIEESRIAICTFRSRSNVQPRMVALVPDSEAYREGGELAVPDGFHVVPLPFKDDLRTMPPVKAASKPSAEAVQAAAKVVKTVRYEDVDPSLFHNPVLQRHLAHLEAISLQEDVDEGELEESLAALLPDPETCKAEKVVRVCERLKEAVDGRYDELLAGPPPKVKREPVKRKREDGEPNPDWKALAERGELEKQTVADLKEACRDLDVAVSGTKGVLVQRIKDAVACSSRVLGSGEAMLKPRLVPSSRPTLRSKEELLQYLSERETDATYFPSSPWRQVCVGGG
eukprot:CAMPEP_0181331356 /NCGR_PEP_ID=MMETSP1101-20121128/24451_1 /TAXON_ID=46948 /ORGANISM="Rhodomonas abbreviata, Strain Caron Lab Isolate" /LENGTH=700 /DNA_ID=CAMNT_0023440797 /DNA_START=202 /DNA_END=2301 /DNA_ORIENTATION=+